jgi:hypothetical protein
LRAESQQQVSHQQFCTFERTLYYNQPTNQQHLHTIILHENLLHSAIHTRHKKRDREKFSANQKEKEKNQTIIKLQMADLGKLLRKLNINGGKRGNDNAFLDELEATEFTIFQPLDNIGYFSWNASGDYKTLST